jgi:hypothetical protein
MTLILRIDIRFRRSPLPGPGLFLAEHNHAHIERVPAGGGRDPHRGLRDLLEMYVRCGGLAAHDAQRDHRGRQARRRRHMGPVVDSDHSRIFSNGNGVPIARLVCVCLAQSADDEDDTDFWLATPGFRESLIEAEADIAAGRTYSAEEVRARFGLAPREVR